MPTKLTLALAACLLTLSLGQQAAAQPTGVHIYTVDFVCGYQSSNDGNEGYEPLVKVANYATKIDLYNYNGSQANLSGDVHDTTAISWTMSSPPQPLANATLMNGGTTLIDCPTIVSAFLGAPPNVGKPFFNGVVTIRSDQPLIVWATKTTEVCAGLVALDESENPEPVIIIGPDGQPLPAPGGVSSPLLPSLVGCPTTQIVDINNGGVPGRYLAPGGAVTPGLRSPGVIQNPQTGEFLLADLSVSHAIDFERVEGIFVELP